METKAFAFEDYKAFLDAWVRQQKGGGRGLYRRMAQELRIHSTMMSHILRGKQHLTEDQALTLSDLMALPDIETEYFLELVRLARAGTERLRERIRQRLARLRDQGQEIKARIASHHQLSPENSARFYSNWYYSALRLLSHVPEFQTRARLLDALPIPRETASEAVDFLLEQGLCREEAGRIVIGPSRTHLPSDSPFVWNLHKNWRAKALERHARVEPVELFYSAPMSIAESDAKKIRELIVQAIANVTKVAAESEAERLLCLNIDWFRVV